MFPDLVHYKHELITFVKKIYESNFNYTNIGKFSMVYLPCVSVKIEVQGFPRKMYGFSDVAMGSSRSKYSRRTFQESQNLKGRTNL